MFCIYSVLFKNTSAYSQSPILVNPHSIPFNTGFYRSVSNSEWRGFARIEFTSCKVRNTPWDSNIVLLTSHFPYFVPLREKDTFLTLVSKLILYVYLKERKTWDTQINFRSRVPQNVWQLYILCWDPEGTETNIQKMGWLFEIRL